MLFDGLGLYASAGGAVYMLSFSAWMALSLQSCAKVWGAYQGLGSAAIVPLFLSICQQTSTHLGKGRLNWWIAYISLACGRVYMGIFLVANWCERAQPRVGGAESLI